MDGDRREVTVARLGQVISRAAVQSALEGPRSLDALLATSVADGVRASTAFRTELILFAFFPFEVVVTTDFPEQGAAVIAAGRERLRHAVNELRGAAGLPDLAPADWHALLDTRFGAYVKELYEGVGGDRGERSARFGALALGRITGGADVLDGQEAGRRLFRAHAFMLEQVAPTLRRYRVAD